MMLLLGTGWLAAWPPNAAGERLQLRMRHTHTQRRHIGAHVGVAVFGTLAAAAAAETAAERLQRVCGCLALGLPHCLPDDECEWLASRHAVNLTRICLAMRLPKPTSRHNIHLHTDAHTHTYQVDNLCSCCCCLCGCAMLLSLSRWRHLQWQHELRHCLRLALLLALRSFCGTG